MRGYSEHTVQQSPRLHRLLSSSGPMSTACANPSRVTRPVLERYQRYLFFYRKKNGEPLTLPLAARAACAVARVVPVDDAAESHPA